MPLTTYALNTNIDANDIEEDFVDALDNDNAISEVTTNSNVTVALPTTVRLNIDYKLIPNLYVNLDLNQTLVKRNNPFNNNGLNHITLSPRFETRIFSAYLPITLSSLGRTSIGAGLKLGPLIVGSGSILSNLSNDNAQTFLSLIHI